MYRFRLVHTNMQPKRMNGQNSGIEAFYVHLYVHLKQNQPSQSLVKGWLSGAGGRTRTADQLITNQYKGIYCDLLFIFIF